MEDVDFITLSNADKLNFISSRIPKFENLVLSVLVSDQDNNLDSLLHERNISATCLKFMIMKLIATKGSDICHEMWLRIFSALPTDIVKGIVKDGVEQMGVDPSQKLSLVYGEIDFFSFGNILERAAPKRGDVFVDLGHGTGKGLICASLLFGPVLSRCHGIEIVPELASISEGTVQHYRDEVMTLPIFEHHRNCSITVEEGDILAKEYSEWTTGDIVFANSTCFDEDLMKAMAAVAEKMKPGSRFITLTKQLPSTEFTLLDRRQYVMSWGEATCFMSVRVEDEESDTADEQGMIRPESPKARRTSSL